MKARLLDLVQHTEAVGQVAAVWVAVVGTGQRGRGACVVHGPTAGDALQRARDAFPGLHVPRKLDQRARAGDAV